MQNINQHFPIIETLISFRRPKTKELDRIDSSFKKEFFERFCDDAVRNRRAINRFSYKGYPVYEDSDEPPIDYGLGITAKKISLSKAIFEVEHFLLSNPQILEAIQKEALPDLEVEEIEASLRIASLLISCLQAREVDLPSELLDRLP